MNTNTMELNMSEMEQVNGGYKKPKTKHLPSKWNSDQLVPAAKSVGNAICFFGKAAINWITGLFD